MKIQKSSKGEWISTFGGVLITTGIMCMAFEASNYFVFGFLLTGMAVTIYGIVSSSREKAASDKIKKK
jgi:F0F1-type ATP synthase assembly protein I